LTNVRYNRLGPQRSTFILKMLFSFEKHRGISVSAQNNTKKSRLKDS
jgi:hypothetical protein